MPRPKQPLISREAAVDAALRLIDEEGYESFSLEKLARAMGVRSPSLYHHFANRSDLLTEAARTLLSQVSTGPDPAPGEWHDWFTRLCLGTYRLIMAHPRAAGLLFGFFPNTVIMPSHERGARVLAEAGLPAADRWLVMRGLEKLVFGMAFADAGDAVHGRTHVPRGVERERYPYLVEAIESGGAAGEDLVERAVRTYLAGVSAQVPASAATTGAIRSSTPSLTEM
ncbi:TetR/AcrR family transcriptional regulator [Pseudonocardia xishanensis]|uniref:HTH tetR-type domain-containing protein n=1 Tax=Pseudonocardia xishanensis TaxID=630995 RepID=A0ABP8RRW2_9PSEU